MAGIYLILFWVSFFTRLFQIHGSGSLYDPPNRAVMWKYGFRTRKNYDYMQLNCGGQKQPEKGMFNCGICGDPGKGKREHEQGGKFGSGTISRHYPAGVREIPVKIELLSYQRGFFEFRICPANDGNVTQECLDRNMLPIKEGYMAGNPMRFYPKAAGDHRLTIAINPNMTCDRCVLQWRYHTGNSWGTDPITKEEGLGYGPQAEYRNCADVRIGGKVPKSVENNPFFGAKYRNAARHAVDTPQKRRKALRQEKLITASLSVQPEHADHRQPGLNDNLFEAANQTTGSSVERASWITQAVSAAQIEAQGNEYEPIVGNRNLGGAATPADTVILKKLVQPADGQIKLTDGTDIVKLGKGEGKIRKIKSSTKPLSGKAMASKKSAPVVKTFGLDNMLSDSTSTHGSVNAGSDVKFTFDSGKTESVHNSNTMSGEMTSQKIQSSTRPLDTKSMTGMHSQVFGTATLNTMLNDGGNANVGGEDVTFAFENGKTMSGQQSNLLNREISNTATGSSLLTSSSSSQVDLNQDSAVTTTDSSGPNWAMHNIATSMIHRDVSSHKISPSTEQSGGTAMTGIHSQGFGTSTLDTMLHDGGSTSVGGDDVKFAFDSGNAMTEQQSSLVGGEMSNTAFGVSFLTSSSSSQVDPNQGNEVTSTDSSGLTREMHNIATGVLGSSDSGRNLEITLPGQSSSIGSRTSELFGLVGPAPNPDSTNTIAMKAATVGGPRINKFGSMRSATRSAVSFLGNRFSNDPFGSSTGINLLSSSKRDGFGQGNDVLYESATTGMRPGNKQRIFQIKVTKPLEMSEGIQPSVDVTAAENASVKSEVVSTKDISGMTAPTLDQFNVDLQATSTSTDGFGQSNTGSDTLADPNIASDISALRNELIREALLQGSDIPSIFSPGRVESGSQTGDIHQSTQDVRGGMSVQNATSPTDFSDSFIENNIDAIVKEANALLSQTTGGSGSFSIDNILRPEKQNLNVLSVNNIHHDQTTPQSAFTNENINIDQSPNTNADVLSIKQESNTIKTRGRAGAESIANDVPIVHNTDGPSRVLEVQNSGPFHEFMMSGGSNGVNSVVSKSASTMNDIISSVVGQKLGGLTIDLTQPIVNKAPDHEGTVGEQASNVVLKSQSVDASNQRNRGTVSVSEGAISEQMTREAQRLNQGMPSLPSGRRDGGRETQRTQSESVDIVRQLSSIDLRNIPAVGVSDGNQMERDNRLIIGGESMPGSRRTDAGHRMDRIGDTPRDRMRGDFADRRRGDRLDSSRRSFGTSDERQRSFSTDRRRGDMDRRRGQERGFRIVVDPRTGLEMRLPVGDSRTDMRFRETPRPFGRRVGDRLVSDMRDGGFRRFGTRTDDRRTRFGMRTMDRGRERERLPIDSRIGSARFGQSRDRSGLDRRGSRDAPYFVDLSSEGSSARVNDTAVVVDTGLAVSGMSRDGRFQDGGIPALMPRDPTEAFSRRTGRTGRREASAESGGGPSDSERSRLEDTRRVIERDLSGAGGRASDRDVRRESTLRLHGDRRFDSVGRSSLRDRRRDTGTRRDSRMAVDGGGGRRDSGAIMRRIPLSPMTFGGFPGGTGMPGVPPFGGPIMPPSGMPGPVMGGPFGGSLGGGPFAPMGFGAGMV